MENKKVDWNRLDGFLFLSACASGHCNTALGAGFCTSKAPPAVVAWPLWPHEHWKSAEETIPPTGMTAISDEE